MNPGKYDDLSNEAYHSAPGISKSGLDLINKSPYIYQNKPKIEPTKAMLIGSAVHTAVLEPEKFELEYACLPSVDGRTKEGKKEISLFYLANEGKTGLKQDEFDLVSSIAKAVRSNLVAANILATSGEAERSFFHNDHETGELLKIRPDWMIDNLLVDLKTTEDASTEGFAKSCWNYRYHVQSAYYLDIANSIMPNRFSGFVFIVVEKSAPYQVAVYYADEAMVDAGRIEYRRNLNLYHECRVSGIWPGINDGKIQPISLPGWALRNIEAALTA